jgi:hypothetical protein
VVGQQQPPPNFQRFIRSAAQQKVRISSTQHQKTSSEEHSVPPSTLVLSPHSLWVASAPISLKSPSPLPLVSSKHMSADDYDFGDLNYTPDETTLQKDREEWYKTNFIRETIFASGRKVTYNDRPLPIIDTADMADSQEMPDSQPMQASPLGPTTEPLETRRERVLCWNTLACK